MTSGSSSVVGLQPRLGDRRPWRVAQLGEARHAERSHRSLRSIRPSTSKTSRVLDAQRLARAARAAPRPCRRDLEPHDLAEAPPAQLGLDRAAAGRRPRRRPEVGVAGHAEHGVLEDLHAREQRGRGVAAMTSSTGTNVRPSPTGDEARQHLLRDLHAREHLGAVCRVAHEHGERQREVGDVRERPAEPDGERRQHREDLAPEALVELVALLRRSPRRSATIADAVLGQRGRSVVQAAATRALLGAHDVADASIVSAGVRPSLPRRVDARRRPGRAARRRGP